MPQNPKNPRIYKKSNKLTFHIRRDKSGSYRWSLHTRNGISIANSPDEGYNRLSRCEAIINLIIKNGVNAEVVGPVDVKKELVKSSMYTQEYLDSISERGEL